MRYKVIVTGGTVYIWRPDTDVGIAPSLEEWEQIKNEVDRKIKHEAVKEEIKNA